MRQEDCEKLTNELIEEIGPAGFLLKATEVFIQANASPTCGREECKSLVSTKAGELAMWVCMDRGQHHLDYAIDVLSQYCEAVCSHTGNDFLADLTSTELIST